MSHRDKSPLFTYHCMVCIEVVSAYTHCWLTGIDQSYLKCDASQNSLLFRSKPTSFRGITLSQLDEPFSCDSSIALRKEGDTVSKRFFDFCLMFVRFSLSISDSIFFISSSSGSCLFVL